ncbi:MAG: DNA polymerase I [Spirochaetaceae bacterium]|jgi:DNA polymerase-1|nr:DNA polymerase I [Spirochaetaceae bacterium]
MNGAQQSSGALPPLYLIDSYALIYRSYFAFISRPLRNGKNENISALFGFSKTLMSILDMKEAVQQKIRLAAIFDSRAPTFRHERYPPYKATRQKAPQDLHAQVPKVEALLSALGIAALRLNGYEADDIIATLVTRCRAEGRGCFILSSDKDLLQLVGEGVYELRQAKGTQMTNLERIGPAEVKAEWGVLPEQILDLLSLTGDASDNIPGVKGVGTKTAVDLIHRFGTLDAIYENIAQISPNQAKKLVLGKENAYLSRELITLVTDVPLDIPNLDEFSLSCLNRAAGAHFLLEEGIPSIARQLMESANDAEKTALSEYEALFSSSDTQLAPVNAEIAAGKAPIPEFRPASSPELLGQGVYRVILNLDELNSYFAQAVKQGIIALDFETDSLDAWHANPVGLSFALKPKEAFYVPLARHGGEEDCLSPYEVRALLAPLLANSKMTIVAHNAKYDYTVSRAWGIPRWKAGIFDTMVGAWMCDSDRSGFSLDSLAFSYLEYTALTYNTVVPKGKNFADVPLDLACRYSAEDADLCMRMYTLLKDRLVQLGSMHLFTEIEMLLVPILAEMEGAGIKIEPQSLKTYSVELAAELKTIEIETWQLAGHEFNLASPKQLQEVLFVERKLKPVKKTKTGWSTDVAVLEELAREDQLPELILQHRSLAKLKSTYVDTLASMTDSKGRVHTHFVQTGTATGRLSSRDPNLQNIPVRAEAGRRIREAFIAEEGWTLISADYSQIELVILAHLSQDKNLIAAFTEGKDVHTRTAALIFGLDEDAITPAQRRIAKTINFGVMYGMGAYRLAGELKISRRDAAEFINAYFKTYSGVRAFVDNLTAQAEREGAVSTLFGRRRAIPTINSSNKTEKAAAERIAVNTPIQGAAADIVKKAMTEVDHALSEFSGVDSNRQPRMLLQVHDELILECAEEDACTIAALVRSAMENTVKLSVPLHVCVEIGKRWGDFH